MELLPQIKAWLKADTPVLLATVVKTWHSAPCGVGSKMAFTPSLQVVGAVSGGCVEGAVIEHGLTLLKGAPAQKLRFGVSDATAWEVGLACGGSIDVWIEHLQPHDPLLQENLHPPKWVTHLITGTRWHLHGLPTPLAPLIPQLEQRTQSGIILYEDEPLFFDVLAKPPHLILVGGGQTSVTLARLASVMGFEYSVIDPRSAFATPERFPDAKNIWHHYPHTLTITPQTAVMTLTHDPKIDDPALYTALKSDAFYVGALGSVATHAQRTQRLLEGGCSAQDIARIHAPIGLAISAKTPDEIALAILAQMVSVWRG